MQKLFWTFNLTDNIEIKTINLQSPKYYRAISKRFQTVKYLWIIKCYICLRLRSELKNKWTDFLTDDTKEIEFKEK